MLNKLYLILAFIYFYYALHAQKPFKEEFFWGLKHPIAAVKVKKISNKARDVYKQNTTKLLLDSFNNGGKLDAFRHVFFMAAFAQKINSKKIKQLGILHEKANYRQFLKHQTENGELPDSLSGVMDLSNNELGIKIGLANNMLTLDSLKLIVIQNINDGEAFIIKRNKLGLYLNCNNQKIDLTIYKKKWDIPKCLVKSNYIYEN